MAWLGTWKKRIKLDIPVTNIDSDLIAFPLLLALSTAAGTGTKDLTSIFAELGSSYLKLAVTKDDGTTQLYVEVAYWDSVSKAARLYCSKSDLVISHSSTTTVYLYFDSGQSDNSIYVGVTGSAVAQSVWDSNYKLVAHGINWNPTTPKTGLWNGAAGEEAPAGEAWDGTNAYVGLMTIPGLIRKINPATMASVGSPWTGATGQNSITALGYFNGKVYAGTNTVDGQIIQIDPSTMTTTASITISGYKYVRGFSFINGYVISVLMGDTGEGHVSKLDVSVPGVITEVAFCNGDAAHRQPHAAEVINGRLFIAYYNNNTGSATVSELNRTTMDIIATWADASATGAYLLTNDGVDLYVLTDTTPAKLYKIQISNMTTKGSPWVGLTGQNVGRSLTYQNGIVYVALYVVPAQVVGVSKDTMYEVSRWTGLANEDNCHILISGNTGILFGALRTNGSDLAKVVKLTVGSFSVSVYNSGSLAIGNAIPFTIEGKVTTSISASDQAPMLKWDGSSGYGIMESGGKVRFFAEDTGSHLQVADGTINISDGISHALAVVRDSANTKAIDYVDGVQDVNPALTATGILTVSRQLTIGYMSRNDGEYTNHWNGFIDYLSLAIGVARPAAWEKAGNYNLKDQLVSWGEMENNPEAAAKKARLIALELI